MKCERRIFHVNDLKLQKRDAKDGDPDGAIPQMRIEGHAAVFGQETDLGYCIEVIEPGFFSDALKRSDPRALFNHDDNYVMGRQSAKTLIVEEDADGLHVAILPPTTELISDMVLMPMQRGDLREMSFAWTTKSDGDKWEDLPGGGRKRTLLPGGCQELYDVSVVTFPAYPGAEASVQEASRRSRYEAWKEKQPPVAPPPTEPGESRADDEFRSRDLDLLSY